MATAGHTCLQITVLFSVIQIQQSHSSTTSFKKVNRQWWPLIKQQTIQSPACVPDTAQPTGPAVLTPGREQAVLEPAAKTPPALTGSLAESHLAGFLSSPFLGHTNLSGLL